jgi:hypothetical protein
LAPILIVSGVVVLAMLIGGIFLARAAIDRLSDGGSSASQDDLYQACADGVMDACTDLYFQSPVGSEAEDFGSTCGNRAPAGSNCSDLDSNSSVDSSDDTYGDNVMLDALWDQCEDGNMGSCDQLYRLAPIGSEYEEFGNFCGGRGREGTWCDE